MKCMALIALFGMSACLDIADPELDETEPTERIDAPRFVTNADGWAHIELYGEFNDGPYATEFSYRCYDVSWTGKATISYRDPHQVNIRIPSAAHDRVCTIYELWDGDSRGDLHVPGTGA